MDDITTFTNKPAVAPQEAKQPKGLADTELSYEISEPKPSELHALGEKPYVSKLVENGDFIYDQFDIKHLMYEIDSFVNSEIKRLHLKDDKNTYKKIYDKYSEKVKDGDVYSKVNKIKELIDIDRKLIEISIRKKELEEKDISDLTSNQILERFNLKRI